MRAYAWCEVAAKHGSQDAQDALKLLKDTVRGQSLIAAQRMTDEIMMEIAASAGAKKLTSPDALSARQF